MSKPLRYRRDNLESSAPVTHVVTVLPPLATADQIGEVLQVSGRWVLKMEEQDLIPAALRVGKVVRFHPPDVAVALGLEHVPEFGVGHLTALQGDVTNEVNEAACDNGLTNDAIANGGR